MKPTITTILSMLAALALVACGPAAGPEGSSAEAEDPGAARAALLEAHEGWVTAFENADVEAISEYLEPSGRLLLFHPERDGRYHNVEEVREGLTHMFDRVGDPAWTEVHLEARVDGNAGWLTYHLLLESSAGGDPFVGRATETWVRHPEGWRLTHAHWSRRPSEIDASGI